MLGTIPGARSRAETLERFGENLKETGRVLLAVLLRDIQTRFGRTYLSFLISIAYPLAHLVVILCAYLIMHSVAPMGDDPAVFAATGLVPYILCMYQSRIIAISITVNKQMLSIPIIRPIHLIFARIISETISSVIVITIFAIILEMAGANVTPTDVSGAFSAILATIYLGIGFGFAHTIANALFGMPGYLGFLFCIIGLYITSGVFIPAPLIPHQYLEWMAYNPLFHCVQWLRSSYFMLDDGLFDRLYIFEVGSVMICFGLVFERAIRGRILAH